VLGVILAAAGVSFALIRTIDSDAPIPTPRAAAEPASAPAPARIRGTAFAGR
jgi:hypothetical protein